MVKFYDLPSDTAEAPAPTVQFYDLPEPSVTESVGAGVQQAGLDLYRQAGGLSRIIGDMFGSSSLANWGRDVGLNAEQAARELTPLGESGGQALLREAVVSTGQSLPALASGALLPALGIMGGQTYLGSYQDARDGGLSVGRSHIFSGVDAIFETATEAWSLPVLFRTGKPFLKKSMEFLSKELAGEEITTIGQTMNRLLSLHPEMTVGEYKDHLKEAMIQTALVTPLTAGMQMGVVGGFQFARRLASGTKLRVAGEPSIQYDANGVPVPVDATGMPQAGPTTPPVALSPDGVPVTIPGNSEGTPEGVDPFPLAPEGTPAVEREVGMPTVMPEEPGYNPLTDEVVMSPEMAQTVDTILVPEVGPQLAAETVPALMLPAPTVETTTAEVPSYADMTPEEIVASEVVDPRIYFGARSRGSDPGYISVIQKNDGTWSVNLANLLTNPGTWGAAVDEGVEFSTAKEALTYIEGNAGLPSHKDLEFVKMRHSVLSMRDAMQAYMPLTPTQIKVYGEQLGRIRDKGVEWRGKTGAPKARIPFLARMRGSLAGLSGTTDSALGEFNPYDETPYMSGRTPATLVQPEGAGRVELVQPKPEVVKVMTPSMEETLKRRAQGREVKLLKYGKLLETWANRYGLAQDRFVLHIVKGTNGSSAFHEYTAPVSGERLLVHELEIGEGLTLAEGYSILAHEFGHALLNHYIYHADHVTVQNLVEQWLDQVNSPAVSWPPKGEEFMELGGINRALFGKMDYGMKKIVQKDWGKGSPLDINGWYNMMFVEFVADQVSQHLYDNNFFVKETAETRKVYDGLSKVLSDFFEATKRMFNPNRTFAGWLDTLAGKEKGNVIVKTDMPKEAKKPEGKKPKQSVSSIQAKRREKLIRVAKKYHLWDDSTASEYDPTGGVDGFQYETVEQLLDMAAVPWEEYTFITDSTGNTAGLPRRDEPDTFAMRQSVLNVARMAPGIPTELRRKLAESTLSIRNFGKGWRAMLTAVQIRKLYGDSIPAVKGFVNGLERMFAYRDKWKRRADQTLELMKLAGPKQRDIVFDILMEEDQSGEFQGEFYTEASTDPNSETGRQNVSFMDPEVMAKRGVTERGAELYSALRRDWADALDVAEKQAIEELWRNYGVDKAQQLTDLSPEKLQAVNEAIARMQKSFAEMKAKPYYPHTRFGDYYVTAKDKASGTTTFAQFESLDRARKFASSLADADTIVRVGEMRDEIRTLMNLPFEVLNSLKGQLELSAQQIAEFEDILKNYTSGESFIKKFKSRKNIEGWENQTEFGPRVYADYFVKFANYISRKQYTPVLNAARADAVKQRNEYYGEGGNVGESLMIDRLLNWMESTQSYVSKPDTELANFKAGVTMWYLGMVPKSALVNAFSVPMMTLPFLGKRYGDMKAATEIAKAYRDGPKSLFKKEALTQEEWKVIDYLSDLGVINESYATELAAVRDGGYLLDSTELGGAKSAFYKLRYAAMYGFHKMEVMNRLVTGLAAYRLARATPTASRGFDVTAAEFAKEAIQDTQNENAQWNRAEFTRGKKAILTQFLTYTQNAMFQMYGGDPAWQRMLALQLIMAGLLGIPFAKNIDDVIRWFAKRVFGTDTSIEQAVRQYLTDVGMNPEWLLKGASYDFLFSGTNLSGSLSMGSIIPGLDALAMEGTFPERLANAASDVGGAGASAIVEVMKALASDDPNTYRRFAKAMPTTVKNMSEGYSMATEGVFKDAAGDPIGELSGSEGVAKMLGFQPTSVSREKEMRFMQKQQAQYWMTRRSTILKLYEYAKTSDDDSAYEKAEDLRDDYNDQVPSNELRLSRSDVKSSLKRRTRINTQKEAGRAPSGRNQELYEDIAGLYSVK